MNALAEQHFRQADEYYQKERVPESIAEWQQAIEADPDWSEAHRRLGVTLWYHGDVAGAIAEYREAIRLDPQDAKPHVSLAFALSQEGQTEEAITESRLALERDPTNVQTRLNLSSMYYSRRDLAAAAEEAREVIRLDPNETGARANLAAVLSSRGDQDGAIRELQAAIKAEPKKADLYARLANCLSATAADGSASDWRAARDAYLKAESLGRLSAKDRWGLAAARWRSGEKGKATQTMETAVAELGHYREDAHAQLFNMQLKTGRLRGAWRTLSVITEKRHSERVKRLASD